MSSGSQTSTSTTHESSSLCHSIRWYALAVKPRHEKSVHRILETKQHEAFLPLYVKKHRYARREKSFQLPWFPGYVFCRFNLASCLPVVTTPGVIRVLGGHGKPTPIDESEVASLKLAVDAQTPIEPWPFLQAGQRIRIIKGALAGMEGSLIHVKQEPRIVLSVTMLQRSVLLELDRDMVAQSVGTAVQAVAMAATASAGTIF